MHISGDTLDYLSYFHNIIFLFYFLDSLSTAKKAVAPLDPPIMMSLDESFTEAKPHTFVLTARMIEGTFYSRFFFFSYRSLKSFTNQKLYKISFYQYSCQHFITDSSGDSSNALIGRFCCNLIYYDLSQYKGTVER